MDSIDLPKTKCYIRYTEQTPNQRYVRNTTIGSEVAKVKKRGAVRNVRGKRVTVRKRAPSGARKRAPNKKSDGPPPPTFHVVELNPQQKCGPATSVQLLFKVRESSAHGAVIIHLVFFDRHGWYCEHGRNCPAVLPARKIGDRARQHGPTHNGRMRA